MASGRLDIGHLILDARKSLAPAPFPPRRDIDFVHASSVAEPDTTVFHDVFWTRQDRISCFIAKLGGGARGGLGAHVLKALLRAALHAHAAGPALDLSLRAFGEAGPAVPIDAAVACLDLRTSTATFGACGAGLSLHWPASERGGVPRSSNGTACLALGDFCWLSIGTLPPRRGGPDAARLVREAVSGHRGAAAAAIELRGLREMRGCRISLSNDVAEIGPALADVEAYFVGEGLPTELLAGLDVALDELLTNIVLYAYTDGQTHEIAIDLRSEGPALTVEIRDDGIPFDPTAGAPHRDLDAALDDRPIGGLGLHFVRTVFDQIAYRRARGWNLLTLSKALATSPPRVNSAPGAASGEDA